MPTCIPQLSLFYLLPCLFTLLTAVACAGEAPVTFDLSGTFAVAEVPATTPLQADEKWIEIRLPISTSLAPNMLPRVSELSFTFDLPSREFQVVDYLPQTTLDSRYAAPIVKKESENRQLGVSVNGADFLQSLGTAVIGTAALGQSSSTETQLKPPSEAIVVSGTVQRGHGVNFKLRPSSGTSLEGAHELLIVARVPSAWRGDVARVRCQATASASGDWLHSEAGGTLSSSVFLLGLHLAGDADAQTAAERFSQSEMQLRHLAADHQRRVEKKASPKLWRTLGVAKAEPTTDWLNDWMYGRAHPELLHSVPDAVRQSALSYSAARNKLHGLCGEKR